MKRFITAGLAMLIAAGCSSTKKDGAPADKPAAAAVKAATFEARHELKVMVPDGARSVRVWMAVPQDDPHQSVADFRVDCLYPSRFTWDSEGNKQLYVDVPTPTVKEFTIVNTFTITRREIRTSVDPSKTRALNDYERQSMEKYLAANEHVIIDDRIRGIARDVVGNERNPIVGARKIYDWVLSNIEYWVKDPLNKKASPVGSTDHCLTTKTGNCTDFHSLWTSIARAAGIPTRMVYGGFFKKPLDGKDADQSYHCWPEFYAPNVGWIPHDVAVADIFVGDFHLNKDNTEKVNLTTADGYTAADPAKVDYYFGNIDERRVVWSTGRDLVLSPRQEAVATVNALAKAYVEVDGKTHPEKTGWTRKLSFKDAVNKSVAASANGLKWFSRRVTVNVSVAEVPSGAGEACVWIPLPPNTPFQQVTNLTIEPANGAVRRESQYGNTVVYFESTSPKGPMAWTVAYDLAHSEEAARPEATTKGQLDRYLQADTLGIIDDKVKETAIQVTEGKYDTNAKARAIYDHVMGVMSYDKETPGWGKGDTKRAREVCKGNCSDYHALFISMARAAGIPARFHYGYSLKADGTGGGHCWAFFWDEAQGWTPVDISEADKNPAKKDYFFGRLSEDRVVVTTGRDITLEPAQRGPALNFLINAYAEIDGKPFDGIKTEVKHGARE